MSLTTGQQALIRRVTTMSAPPNVVLPNGKGKPLPRYVVQASGGSQSTFDLSGTTDSRPEIVVRVETEADEFATENDSLVAALVARFKPGDEFDGVEIMDAPLPRPPLEGDGVYSVPVIIRGRYIF